MKLPIVGQLAAVALLLSPSTLYADKVSNSAPKSSLVSAETIRTQKELTSRHKLKNGIPVTLRSIPGSDIVQINVNIEGGIRDLPTGQKSLNGWLFSTMSLAADGYSKQKVFELSEKYALSIGCGGGVEVSSCGLGTINSFWKEGLPILAAIVRKPALTEEDVGLTKKRITASLRATPQDPDGYVNEVVNTIYYPPGHPYRLNHDEALAEMEKLNRADLARYHAAEINAAKMEIVVVSSMPQKQLLRDLEKAFGDIKSSPKKTTIVPSTPFDKSKTLLVVDRDIPTAYIRGKFVAPEATHKDAVASRLLFEILTEELGDEIRTRRSLSYSVYAFQIQYTKGIGVMGATTSKPEETISAMNEVIRRVKTHDYSPEQLAQFKNVFATAYFLTQETHGSLAGAISSASQYFGSTDQLYDFPAELEKVTAADIKRLANEVLVDFQFGVIFNRKAFKDEWIRNLVNAHLGSKTH